MDNLFDILFILFVIFSFLAPLFTKKKDKGSSSPAPSSSRNESSQNSNEDLLSELERMFYGDEKDSEPEVTAAEPKNEQYRSQNNREYKSTTGDYGYEAQQDFRKKIPEKPKEFVGSLKGSTVYDKFQGREFIDPAEAYKKRKQKEAQIDEMTRHLDNSVSLKTDIFSGRSARIIDHIRNPEKLRDYIIIQELLNKPKALRR